MISHKRSKVPIPKKLTGSGAGPTERRKNSKHIANKDFKKVKHTAYKEEEVREALKALFGRKCVYCESSLLGNQPGDIEHFRPKGKVVVTDPVTGKELLQPGYPWLAACWNNLLLACADCNRPRKQADISGGVRKFGKGCYFPLPKGCLPATRARDIKLEQPLLLNPCIDEPERHIEFTDLGGIFAKHGSGGVSEKGEATIKYCGLDRAELMEARLRHRRTVIAAIRHIVIALERGTEPGEDLDDLVALLHPMSPYVAFTRHLVSEKLGPYLTGLGITI